MFTDQLIVEDESHFHHIVFVCQEFENCKMPEKVEERITIVNKAELIPASYALKPTTLTLQVGYLFYGIALEESVAYQFISIPTS